MRAYHFLRHDMRAGSGDEPAWKVGETRTYEGECVLCSSGYHSSPSWLDALQYAPGEMACIVDVSEPVEKEAKKQVSKTRTLVDYRDATRVLHLFACECAERALKAANVTDERSWNAIKVKRLWLDGKATKDDLVAARAAAMVAAMVAAWDAAWDAAMVAAWDAAMVAARDAAWAVARAAAWDAAWGAAWDAEREWPRNRLNEMMHELFEGGNECI